MRGAWFSHERYPVMLFALLVVFGGVLAIAPHDRADWALENALLFGGVAVLVALRRQLPLSRVSYTLIFIFCCLHSIGAHYTYSEVPYQAWLAALPGGGPAGGGRWGGGGRGFWGYYLPLDVTMATSMIYELIEWGAAVVFGGDLGVAYLGSQGDPWDAQKDMALATVGAIVAMLVTAALNWRYQRDFAREWAESLRVKHAQPLGEDELRRLIRESR